MDRRRAIGKEVTPVPLFDTRDMSSDVHAPIDPNRVKPTSNPLTFASAFWAVFLGNVAALAFVAFVIFVYRIL